MKKINIIKIIIVVLMMAIPMNVNAEAVTGEIAQEIPDGYTPIYDIDDLYAIRNNPSGNYILMNDIDMTEATSAGGDNDCGTGWDSIETFSGVLEGNGHRIIGMQIFGNPSSNYRGLFEELDGAIVQNLGMQNVNIQIDFLSSGGGKNTYVGAIAASAESATIKGCWVTGIIKSKYALRTGGIVGSSNRTTFVNCYNVSNITSDIGYCGGIVGGTNGDRFKCVYNVGSISGSIAGSLIGSGYNSGHVAPYCCTVENSYYLKNTAESIENRVDTTNTVMLTEAQMKKSNYFTGFDFDTVWEIDPYCSYPYPQLKNNRIVRVSSLDWKTQPSKLIYNQGDKLDLSDAAIEICYEDDVTTEILITADMVSGYDMNKIGTQTVIVAYGGIETSFDIEVKEIPVTSIAIPKTLSIYRSKTYQFEPEILPLNATDKAITWESEDSSIVSVDDKGLLKAKAKGKTKVKVTTANGLTQECEVTVLVASAVVTLNQTEVILESGKSIELTAKIAPLESTDTITWESSNEKVAEVTEGIVVAKSEGIATISAYTESGIKATCKVTVKASPSAIGTILTVKDSKCKVRVLCSDVANPTVAYIAPTNKNSKSVKIPATVTVNNVTYKIVNIESGAFSGCKKLKSIKLGENITTIGSKAFYNCTGLTKVTIPSKVTKIDSYAFKNCKKLSSITIGSSVTTIGKEAFRNCGKLKKITIKSKKLKTVGKNAFKGIHSNAKIKVPKAKYKAYKKLLKSKGQSKKVKITK